MVTEAATFQMGAIRSDARQLLADYARQLAAFESRSQKASVEVVEDANRELRDHVSTMRDKVLSIQRQEHRFNPNDETEVNLRTQGGRSPSTLSRFNEEGGEISSTQRRSKMSQPSRFVADDADDDQEIATYRGRPQVPATYQGPSLATPTTFDDDDDEVESWLR